MRICHKFYPNDPDLVQGLNEREIFVRLVFDLERINGPGEPDARSRCPYRGTVMVQLVSANDENPEQVIASQVVKFDGSYVGPTSDDAPDFEEVGERLARLEAEREGLWDAVPGTEVEYFFQTEGDTLYFGLRNNNEEFEGWVELAVRQCGGPRVQLDGQWEFEAI